MLSGERALFEILMRRHNQRIYRIVRGILRDDGEAEDVMQDAYVRAYQHLAQFEGRSTFVTWLSRIAMHEAFCATKRQRKQTSLDSDYRSDDMNFASPSSSPEKQAANAELGTALEAAILSLPQKYRSVVILRDVEELTTAEAASTLEISEDAIKVRLHRAHAHGTPCVVPPVGSVCSRPVHLSGDTLRPGCCRRSSAVFNCGSLVWRSECILLRLGRNDSAGIGIYSLRTGDANSPDAV